MPGLGTRTTIRLARHGVRAGVLGAALLAAHELETPSSPRPDAISGTASPVETPTAMGQG